MSNIAPIDPLFIAGRQCMQEKNYSAAIELFNNLVVKMSTEYGDKSIEAAPAWFEYGIALLTKEQDCPSDELLGNTNSSLPENDNEKANDVLSGKKSVGLREEEEESYEEVPEFIDAENQDDDEEEDINDLQIAWEAFEMCRIIYEWNKDLDNEVSLSEVYVALGDLEVINNHFEEAIGEFLKALEIRKAKCDNKDRLMSEVYFSLATAYLYRTSTNNNDNETDNIPPVGDETTEPPTVPLSAEEIVTYKTKALEYYQLSKQSIDLWIADSKSKTDESNDKLRNEINDRVELVDEITETIDGLILEIKELKDALSVSSTSTSKSATGFGVTTIGFGSSSSSSSSLINTAKNVPMMSTNDYFLNMPNASTSTSSSTTITALPNQIKKKDKLQKLPGIEPESEVAKKKQREI